jgi:hypothetical protein
MVLLPSRSMPGKAPQNEPMLILQSSIVGLIN